MKRRKFLQACLVGSAAPAAASKFAGFSRVKPGTDHLPFKSESQNGLIVKVLGTAQDGGLPQIGCFCRNCRRARQEPEFARRIAALAVIDLKSRKYFLVDATPDIRAQTDMVLTRIGLGPEAEGEGLQGILLTHAHIGHYTGLMFYGYESMGARNLPVYCSQSMARFLSSNGPWDQLVKLNNITLKQLTPRKPYELISGLQIASFLVPHRDEYTDTLGFYIMGPSKKLLYIPDIHNWETWDHSLTAEVKKVDFALLDGTFFGPDELPGRNMDEIGHPFISATMKILGSSGREERNKVYFTHFNHSNPVLDPAGKPYSDVQAQGFHLAEDGAEFSLD